MNTRGLDNGSDSHCFTATAHSSSRLGYRAGNLHGYGRCGGTIPVEPFGKGIYSHHDPRSSNMCSPAFVMIHPPAADTIKATFEDYIK